jgi:hypothetical protein
VANLTLNVTTPSGTTHKIYLPMTIK